MFIACCHTEHSHASHIPSTQFHKIGGPHHIYRYDPKMQHMRVFRCSFYCNDQLHGRLKIQVSFFQKACLLSRVVNAAHHLIWHLTVKLKAYDEFTYTQLKTEVTATKIAVSIVLPSFIDPCILRSNEYVTAPQFIGKMASFLTSVTMLTIKHSRMFAWTLRTLPCLHQILPLSQQTTFLPVTAACYFQNNVIFLVAGRHTFVSMSTTTESTISQVPSSSANCLCWP